jgi:hypothetical protein
MTPAQLGYCIKGHELKRKEQDSDMWHFAGTYGISALIYAIDRCLNGKKARSEYIKKPVSILLEEESKPKSKESNEDVAMFEMQQRIKMLEKEGGILSPS